MAKPKDSFLLKFFFLVGFVWLAVVVMVNLPGSQLRFTKGSDALEQSAEHSSDLWKSQEIGDGSFKQPVIERLDLDRLRFEDARRRDAAVLLQEKEQLRKEMRIREEIDRRRAMDRMIPPFKLMQNSTSDLVDIAAYPLLKSTAGKNKGPSVDGLIKSGLIVPRWGDFIEHPLDPKAPGEHGNDVSINKDNLPRDEKEKFEQGWQKNAFNQYASDLVSVHRSLPDVRDTECKSLKYHDNLPDTSVIIIFHNEAWSALLRTVHSVLDRSPPELIKEVILVDDFSDLPHLLKPLEDYTAKLLKVHVLRAKSRQGLIRARLLGASRAMGQVLTFLDSHCECTRGWLEPLLDRIAENKSNVVTPIIDVLDDSTLRYQYSSARTTSVGGFDWNLQFNWHAIPQRELARRKSVVEPVRSPTMAGGLFSIDKSYFEYLGTYDPGMDIWGGENLELSFRVWMCGGALEIVLCSHVGHIFRKRSPYSWGSVGNILKKNTVRLAEVWLDDQKKYYYERLGNDLTWMCGGALEIVLCSHVGHIFRSRSPYKWRTGVNIVKKNSIRVAEVWMDDYKTYYFERFNFDLGDYGDVTARKELRKKLNCKSFNWYLTNIFPEMFVPGDSAASGEIRNKALGTFNGQRQPICLDSAADRNSMSKPVALWPCHNMGGNQYWMLSKNGEIRRDEACMDVTGSTVIILACHGGKGNQEWSYTAENTLLHMNTKKCLELSVDGLKIMLQPCSRIDRQEWLWRRRGANATSDSSRE